MRASPLGCLPHQQLLAGGDACQAGKGQGIQAERHDDALAPGCVGGTKTGRPEMGGAGRGVEATRTGKRQGMGAPWAQQTAVPTCARGRLCAAAVAGGQEPCSLWWLRQPTSLPTKVKASGSGMPAPSDSASEVLYIARKGCKAQKDGTQASRRLPWQGSVQRHRADGVLETTAWTAQQAQRGQPRLNAPA